MCYHNIVLLQQHQIERAITMNGYALKVAKNSIIIITAVLLFLLALSQSADAKSKKSSLPAWAKGRVVAHAGGGIEGTAYTNSVEALSNTLNSGARCVEIDFAWTSDHRLVCAHKSTLFKHGIPSEAEFLQSKAAGKYTQMTAATALKMLSDKGVYMIMDTQENDAAAVYAEIYQTLKAQGNASYMKKVVPQMYRKGQYKKFRKVYKFKYGILTLYKYKPLTQKKLRSVASFCRKKHLVVTINSKRYKKKSIRKILKQSNVVVAVHTVNDSSLWKRLRKKGASIVYTDFMTS